MSAGEPPFVCNENVNSCGVMKSKQNNGKRSFIISVDNCGKIEVSPRGQDREMPKIANEEIRCGKYRMRIALLEDGESSDEEQEANDIIRIYNKTVKEKPSFVVLEDVVVRKRAKQTLHSHCECTTCHCNAQQQTTPCDIGAHTGSQTDEFLLNCALRTQMLSGQSIGCQASDANVEMPVYSRVNTHKRPLRRLSEIHALQLAKSVTRHVSNQQAAVQSTTTAEPATSVTISFIPQNGSQVLQQQQQQQENMVSAATAAHSLHGTCCTNLVGLTSCACSNCRPPAPATHNSKYCLGATNSNNVYFCRPHIPQQQQVPQQQQQQCAAHLPIPHAQQQYQCSATTYHNCGSSCCLLRPAMAQTSLSCDQPLSSNHSVQHMPFTSETPAMSPAQPFSMAAWPPQTAYPYLYYPVPTYSMVAFGEQQYTACPTQVALYGEHYSEHQQNVCAGDSSNSCRTDSNNLNSTSGSLEVAHLENPVRRERTRKHKVEESPQLVTDQQVELKTSASQVTVRRLKPSVANGKLYKKILDQHVRNKAGACTPPVSKLYMARFGRTCLILKPTKSSIPPHHL